MASKKPIIVLSRRERQIMDIVYRRGEASVSEVLGDLDEAPSYSAVRAFLRILEEKGHLKHKKEGPRYIYMPTRSREKASRTALKRILQTFFDGSVEEAVAALLDVSDMELTEEQLADLAKVISRANGKGK
ncbi:MAG: BlaI/MecI/CopY family transcriptional regulator [Planctomycetes bacterium]|nr:BlaI/MecI/CopY family transcriptional regulator [Planctomycetota bacterium]